MRSVALAIVLLLATPAVAQAERPYHVKIFAKFARGVVNVAFSPTEIYINGYKEGTYASRRDDITWADVYVGAAAGGIVGIGYMFMRIGVGVVDIVSFPVPTKPLMQPATPQILLEGLDT